MLSFFSLNLYSNTYENINIEKEDINIFFDEKLKIDKVEILNYSIIFYNTTLNKNYTDINGNSFDFLSEISFVNPNNYLSSKIVGCTEISSDKYDNRSVILDNSCSTSNANFLIVEPSENYYTTNESIFFEVQTLDNNPFDLNFSVNGNDYVYSNRTSFNFKEGEYIFSGFGFEYLSSGIIKNGSIEKSIVVIPWEIFEFKTDESQSGNEFILKGEFLYDFSNFEYFDGVDWISLDFDIVNNTIDRVLTFNNLDIDTLLIRYDNIKNQKVSQNKSINVEQFKLLNSNLDLVQNIESKNLEIDFSANFSADIESIEYYSNGIKQSGNYLINENDKQNVGGELFINDFGELELLVKATDKYGYVYEKSFTLNLTEIQNNDKDNDLINDSEDKIVFSEEILTTNIEDVKIKVDSKESYSNDLEGENKIEVLDENDYKYLEFNHNFSKEEELVLDFTLLKYDENNLSGILIKDLKKQEDYQKTIYLDRDIVSNRETYLCVANKEVSSIEEISELCNSENEYLFRENSTINGIEVVMNNEQYIIKNLDYSAVKESCIYDLSYTDWTQLDSQTQIRYYTDNNNCIEDGSETREVVAQNNGGGGSSGSSGGGSGGGGGSSNSNSDSGIFIENKNTKKENKKVSITFEESNYEIYINNNSIRNLEEFDKGIYDFKIINKYGDEIFFTHNIEKYISIDNLIRTFEKDKQRVILIDKETNLLIKKEENERICIIENGWSLFNNQNLNCDKDFEEEYKCRGKICEINLSNKKGIYVFEKGVEIKKEIKQEFRNLDNYETKNEESILKIVNIENRYILHTIIIIILIVVAIVLSIFVYEKKYKFRKYTNNHKHEKVDLKTHILKVKKVKSKKSLKEKIKNHFKPDKKVLLKDYINEDGRYIVHKNKKQDVEDEIKEKLKGNKN